MLPQHDETRGCLTTHVLDTMHGRPAAGMTLSLLTWQGDRWLPVKEACTNTDGRVDGPLLAGETFHPGRYRLSFQVAAYFRAQGVTLPEPAFLDEVVLDFGLAEASHYHVPLLVSPWAYSTYRGS